MLQSWRSGVGGGEGLIEIGDDVGDRKADAFAVNEDTITVRQSSGSAFGPNEDWTHGPFFGSQGTFFANVTGDRKADAIAVSGDTITVRQSSGSAFGPNEDWTHGPFFGSQGTFFADVTGDDRADAIAVNNNTTNAADRSAATWTADRSVSPLVWGSNGERGDGREATR